MGCGPQPAWLETMRLPADPQLAIDLSAAALLTGHFILRSGTVSDHYFDKYRFESDPALLRRIASRMVKLLPSDTEILAGLELGGVPLATAMSLECGLPAVFVRKAAKTYGTCQAVEGGDVSARQIVMIEDVISTGGAVFDAAQLLLAAGADLAGVICAVWRGEGEPGLKSLPGVPVSAAFVQSELR